MVLLWVVWVGVGLLLARDSLAYDWFYDDLHLVRVFSAEELTRVMVGNWDLDQIETPGYRPLTVLFNHSRMLLFGEAPFAHRVAQIGLLAFFLVLVAGIARAFEMSYAQIALAGILTLLARNNWYNLIWIADGIHAFNGILLAGGAWLGVSAMQTPRVWKFALALLLCALGLLTREESLVFLPLVPLAMLAMLFFKFPAPDLRAPELRAQWFSNPHVASRLRWIVWMTLALVGISAAYWMARAWIAPAPLETLRWLGWGRNAQAVMDLRGITNDLFQLLWYGCLGFLFGVSAFLTRGAARWRAFGWLGAFALTCALGILYPRANLLLYPITFFCFALVVMLDNVRARSRSAFVVAAVLTLILAVWTFQVNSLAQLVLHPDSIEYLALNGDFVFRRGSTIPPERRARLQAQFAARNIYSYEDLTERLARWRARAENNKLYAPNSRNIPFLPPIAWLSQ